MKILNVFESISLDGYFTDRNGDMSWAHGAPDAEYDGFVADNASSGARGGGAMLFGRVTYEMMASFWPTAQARQTMPAVAEAMNSMRKIVFSRTLREASWQNTQLIAGDLVTEVQRLKREGTHDLTILGSGTLVAQLTEAGLVDELQLVLVPIVLGAGRSLFDGVEARPGFAPTRTRTFTNGKVFVAYRPSSREERRAG